MPQNLFLHLLNTFLINCSKFITWDFYSTLLHVYNRADIYHCPVMETITAICADSSWYKTNIKFL